LPEALGFAINLEQGSPAGADLARWRSQIAAGIPQPLAWMAGTRTLPPLLTWLVAQAGEDLAAGFRRAADVYHARALYRLELLLYLALPLSILALGAVLVIQLIPLFQTVIRTLDALGNMAG
jgi:type II secretory pathway component PulF